MLLALARFGNVESAEKRYAILILIDGSRYARRTAAREIQPFN